MSRVAWSHVDPSVDIAAVGIRVTPLTAAEIQQHAVDAIRHGRRLVIANHNLHSVYLATTDSTFRRAYDRFDLTVVDGFPVLLAAGAATGHWLSGRRRVGSMDWVPALLRGGEVRRIAVVGASADSNSRAVDRILAMAPQAQLLGLEGAGWTDARAVEVAAELRAFRPELVLVGIGMPTQEAFLADFLPLLPAAVYVTVGGAIDQIAGVQGTAPRWLGPIGLEWLWRLLTQPRRLGFRYLVEPLLLLQVLARGRRDAQTAALPERREFDRAV